MISNGLAPISRFEFSRKVCISRVITPPRRSDRFSTTIRRAPKARHSARPQQPPLRQHPIHQREEAVGVRFRCKKCANSCTTMYSRHGGLISSKSSQTAPRFNATRPPFGFHPLDAQAGGGTQHARRPLLDQGAEFVTLADTSRREDPVPAWLSPSLPVRTRSSMAWLLRTGPAGWLRL